MPITLKIGTRSSKLAEIQAKRVLDSFRARLHSVRFTIVPFSSPGDRDRETDLRQSPPDFFTQDLDQALAEGRIDAAVHSAKDLPEKMPEGLDWFWLPWVEDSRDCLVLPKGHTVAGLPLRPCIGVSSDRRDTYCQNRFPEAERIPVRGNIDMRLQQLDQGRFDVLVMAGAALLRLGLTERITEWIPLSELPTPVGQGVLAVTFRSGNVVVERIRDLFVKTVTFAGAGVGDASFCTLAALEALKQCNVCLHDALLDNRLLNAAPGNALCLDVGKRSGSHRISQASISETLALYARRGKRVLRLKGGDPGLFGRLAEELDHLGSLRLPCRVIPGVSSLQCATTGNGLLLTRRGVSRGFCAMTPRSARGMQPVDAEARCALPLVLFMATTVCRQVAEGLIRDGMAPDTPAAVVFNAGASDMSVVEGTLTTLPPRIEKLHESAPGILLVGNVLAHRYNLKAGALRQMRILLTCSQALVSKASLAVLDHAGIPISFPMIQMVSDPDGLAVLRRISAYAWIVLTSPSAVHFFLEGMAQEKVDPRQVPRLAVCGPGTSRALQAAGFQPDCEPEADFGAKGLIPVLRTTISPGMPVLRFRSDVAGTSLSERLRKDLGMKVDDVVLYRNRPVSHDHRPPFDAALFASSSAVSQFVRQWGLDSLHGKITAVMGQPTAETLRRWGREPDVVADLQTIESCVETLAAFVVNRDLESCT